MYIQSYVGEPEEIGFERYDCIRLVFRNPSSIPNNNSFVAFVFLFSKYNFFFFFFFENEMISSFRFVTRLRFELFET